jgi:6-phosphofructokinase 1
MNAAVRAVVRTAIQKGIEVYGIVRGYQGLLEGEMTPLSASSVANILQRGGTVLKTARCEEFHKRSARKAAGELLKRKNIDALVVIGGDGSFHGAHLLENETGIRCIGVPGTIDNDIYGSDDTIGFDTAVNTAIDSIDRIRDTANSHDRIFVVEVMGRSSGYIGLLTGIGGGAETILIPEERESISSICKTIERGIQRGKSSSIIVVSEGEVPGYAQNVADELEQKGYHSKVCILGHIQRGGTPSAHDRMLATVLGSSAVQYLLAGKSDAMVGTQNGKVVIVPFKQVVNRKKKFPKDLYQLAQIVSS